jgi:NAD(P)-dependent dehydrogenase (short-subunit alcohol dehydrogenase family)
LWRATNDLEGAVEAIRHQDGRAVHVVADVAVAEQVDHIADVAVREFGRIDTWVNNAAVSMYGRTMEVSTEDMRRQMDVNYWGQVYGSRVAVRHMQARGGALINVASALADRAIPLQGNYCAAKHALKAFTDALRMELEEQGIPVSVTLVCCRSRHVRGSSVYTKAVMHPALTAATFGALVVTALLLVAPLSLRRGGDTTRLRHRRTDAS